MIRSKPSAKISGSWSDRSHREGRRAGSAFHSLFLSRQPAEFNDVAVGVFNENLPRSVRAKIEKDDFRAFFFEMALARVDVRNFHREMIAARILVNRCFEPLDQVKFARFAEGEPGSIEIERRARLLPEADNFFIKTDTSGNVTDSQCDVVEIKDFNHGIRG